jgi:hypothetical protein
VGTYVIAGKGDVSPEVLAAGLGDLPHPSMFFVPWIGSENTRPTEGLRKVYDYLVDEGYDFTLLAKDKASVHPAIAEAADKVVESGNASPELHFDVIPPDATALILWSEEDTEHSEGLVCEYFDRGHTLLDLSNGMTPIQVTDVGTTPPAHEADSPTQKDEIPPITDEDLKSMPDGVRKQLDRSLGNSPASELPEDAQKDTAVDEMSAEEVEAKILQFVRKEEETDESQYATVVVVLPTGRSFTTTVPILNLWALMKATVWKE